MVSKKKLVLLLIAVCLLGIAAYLYSTFCQQEAQEELVLQGNVDVREVSLAFRQSDRILELLVEEGDRVQKGQALFRMNVEAQAAAVRELQKLEQKNVDTARKLLAL